MKLKIRVISGQREGMIFELGTASSQPSGHLYVLEDEALSFTIELDSYHDNLALTLHESEVRCTSSQISGEKWIYQWFPQRTSKWGHECFFHNYYGLAELTLTTRAHDSNEIEIIEQFNPLEVLAKKINAERVDKMLEFLAGHDNEALAAFFRVTRIKAGFKEGDKAVNFLIEQLERNVALLALELPRICSKPIAKLNPETKIVTASENSSVDDTTLAWLTENSDILYPVDDNERALLELEGNFYTAHKILENHLKEEVNIYENQVIHGFLISLIRAASEILTRLEAPASAKFPTRNEVNGYLSFFSQLSRFAKIINKNKVERCKKLISTLQALNRTIKEKIPVSAAVIGTPQFTKKARYNIHYQKIFHKIIAWHRFGAPDWSVQEELFSIQSIPKLFEYYLLFLIKNHLDSERIGGQRLELIRTPNSDSYNFDYTWGEYTVRLIYEMKAWTHDHVRSESSPLINSEGWTHQRNGDVTQRKGVGVYSNRSPDILINLTCESGENLYFIIDAKYTNSKKAFTHYLPELTMKYIHGLHEKNTGKNLSIGLMIVNPDENCQTRHFHHHRYSIFGKNPVSPALLVSSITPGHTELASSDFKKNISQILFVMKSRVKSEAPRLSFEVVA